MTLNRVKILIVLPVGICFFYFSCAQSAKKINPEAKRLNDSAMRSVYKSKDFHSKQVIENAIGLLNQAIKTDSNYFTAYNNKFMFQYELNRYSDAILTGKQIIKLRPNNIKFKMTVGGLYEKTGDTLLAADYYKSALLIYNKVLDTMSIENNAYKVLVTGKAIDLIFLNRQKEGYGIFKELYIKEKDPVFKEMLKTYMNTTRHDFLYPESEQIVTYPSKN